MGLTLDVRAGGHWGPSLAVTGWRKLVPIDQKKARRLKGRFGFVYGWQKRCQELRSSLLLTRHPALSARNHVLWICML